MSDPKQVTLSFPLNLGANTASDDEFIQPNGDRPSFRRVRNVRMRGLGSLAQKNPGYTVLRSGTVGGLCGGFAPSGTLDSTVQFLLPGEGNRRIASGATALLPSIGSTSTQQNLAYPALIPRSISAPSALASSSPAVAVFGDLTFVAMLRPFSGTADCGYVMVYDSTGAIRVPPTVVTNAATCIGLTSHASGIRLWALVSGVLYVASVSVSGLTLTVGSLVSVYTPGSSTVGTVKICSDGTDFAWITAITTGVTNTATLIRRDILAGTNTTQVLPPATTSSSWTACAAMSVGGTSYVAVQVIHAGGAHQAVYDGTALTVVGTAATVAGLIGYTDPQCSFGIDGSGSYAVFAATGPSANGFAAGTTVDTTVHWRALSSSTLIATNLLPWYRLLGAGLYKRSDTEAYPVFSTQHVRDVAYTNDSTSVEFLIDPSIEVFWGSASRLQCVGRLGCDAAKRYNNTVVCGNSKSIACSGERVIIGYLEDQTRGFVSNPSGYQVRVSELDFSTHQARSAPTAQGPSVIAGALPLHWDGFELTEPCAMHQPAVRVATSGGSGGALTGTYSFRAVYQWRDSAGQIHRSAPSLAVTATLTAQQPVVTVDLPVLFRDGTYQEQFEIVVYATLAGGTTFYAQSYTPTAKSAWVWTFGSVSSPGSGALNPILYTTGGAQQPLIAYCPPAFSDVALIGSRLWGVDAEKPWRVWPSKTKEEGVAFEFNPDLVVSFPASAGAILAVSEARGYPVFLCERGVWAVAGEGPNNSLIGQGFSAPLQLSAIPCTSRESVVRTPAGVMFLSGDRFAVANESGAQILDVMDASQ